MDDLARHIEVLLLENDCVIVPGLGGFITQYQPATASTEDDVLAAPCRTVGFNPLLRLNDGLLVQSYMSAYSTSYFEASKIIEQQTAELTARLHEDGKVELHNVGELQYDIEGRYRFVPQTDKIPTPTLYGLDSLVMPTAAALEAQRSHQAESPQAAQPQHRVLMIPTTKADMPTETPTKTGRVIHADFGRAARYAAGIAAAIVAVLASFFFATPLQDTITVSGNYADMTPKELFEQFDCHSLLFSAVVTGKDTGEQPTDIDATTEEAATVHTATTPTHEPTSTATTVAAKPTTTAAEVPASQPQTTTAATANKTTRMYNVIVASVGSTEGAEGMVRSLKTDGHAGAKVIEGDGKIRVSIESFAAEADAYKAIRAFQQQGLYPQAWVLHR